MALIKVNELDGPYLSYWVARAIGTPADQVAVVDRQVCVVSDGDWPLKSFKGRHQVDYAGDWDLAGPLIHKGLISVMYEPDSGIWSAFFRAVDDDEYTGPTPLIAAMRARVASFYGDEVPAFVVWPKGGTETAPDGVPA